MLGEIDALPCREIIVVNKIDAADEMTADPAAARCSPARCSCPPGPATASTSCGWSSPVALPDPAVAVRVLMPFTEGALVSRVHAEGTVLDEEHTADGTRLHARVYPDLAGVLAPFAAAG